MGLHARDLFMRHTDVVNLNPISCVYRAPPRPTRGDLFHVSPCRVQQLQFLLFIVLLYDTFTLYSTCFHDATPASRCLLPDKSVWPSVNTRQARRVLHHMPRTANIIYGRRTCPRLVHGEIQQQFDPQQLHAPDFLCSERYAAEITCGNLTYLFTRHDLGDHKASQSASTLEHKHT